MREIDRKLAEALGAEDTELGGARGGDPSLAEMIADSFHGRRRWLVALVWFWALALFAVSVYAAVRFFGAETERGMIGWGLGFVIGMMAVSMLKIWYFMEMNRNNVVREIKRVELQIARLVDRLPSSGGGPGGGPSEG